MKVRLDLHHSATRVSRQGYSLTELLVACVILATVVPTMATLFVTSRRVMQETRHERMMLGEISSQLEVLAVAPEQVGTSQPRKLVPSEFIEYRLPSATLIAEVTENESGRWLKVTGRWKHRDNERSVELAHWIEEVQP